MTARPYLYGTNVTGAGAGSHATVTTGSNLVTGTGGTAFTGISFADWFSMGGVAVPVLEVVDDSHLHLAYNWPGGNITAGDYSISAGIDSTDARRYGWYVAQYYQRLANIPADTGAFRDQAVAAAAAADASATTAAASATLSSAWSSTAFNTDVPGAAPGSRSAMHWAIAANGAANAATTNGAAQVTLAAAQVTLAAAWANTPFNTDVPGAAPGSRSSLHYSQVSANNATLASTNGAAQVTLAAAQVALATGQVAIAQAWSSQAFNTDVTTNGTRSAYHWSVMALNTYNATVGIQTTVQGYVATASAYVQLAADWAQKGAGLDVNGVGTRSSYHWSVQSAGSATASASSATAAAGSAVAAAASAAALGNPDYGMITDSPVDHFDYGTVP